jgi:hypothetical protein
MSQLSFDGCGINGPDEYRTRVATFQTQADADKYGKLFAAAPELLAIAKAYRNLLHTAAHTDGEVATFQHIEQVIAKVEVVQ